MTVASIDKRGGWCGRAVHGVSSMSFDDIEQARAYRMKDRPTPWQALALRFNVNEADLRNLIDPRPSAEPPAPPAPHQFDAPKPGNRLDPRRDRLIRSMWVAGEPVGVIATATRLSESAVRARRIRMGLTPRHNGGLTIWTDEDDETLRRLWHGQGMSATAVGKIMGKSRCAVIRRAHRLGLRRHEASELRVAA